MTFTVGGVDVTAVNVGATPAVAVYLGSEKVWPVAGGGAYFRLAESLGAVFAQNGQYDSVHGTDLFAGDRRYEVSAIPGPGGAGDAVHNYTGGLNDNWQQHQLTGMSTTDTVLTMCGFSYMDIAATWASPGNIDGSYPTNIDARVATRVGNLRLSSTPRMPGRGGIGAFIWDLSDIWDTHKLVRVDNSDYAPLEWCFFYASVEQPGTYSAGVYSSTTGWIRQTGTTPTGKSIGSLSTIDLAQGPPYYHVAGWCVFPTRLTDIDIDALLAAGTSP